MSRKKRGRAPTQPPQDAEPSKTAQTPEHKPDEAPPLSREDRIKARAIELMGMIGVSALDAAAQALRENPAPKVGRRFEVSIELPARLWKFIDRAHPTQADKDHMIRYLIGLAHRQHKLFDAERYGDITDKAASVPRDMFSQKAGLG